MTDRGQTIKWALLASLLLLVVILARHLTTNKREDRPQSLPAKRTSLETRTSRLSRTQEAVPTPPKQKAATPRALKTQPESPTSGALVLAGNVLNDQNQPVKGALVSAFTPPLDDTQEPQLLGTTKSDASGRYQLGIAARPPELLARATAEHSAPDEILLNVSTNTTSASGPLFKSADFRLVEGQEVTGIVMDSQYKPIAGAEIQLIGDMSAHRSLLDPDRRIVTRVTHSAPDGTFTITGVSLGNNVHVSAPNHPATSVKVDNLEKLLRIRLSNANATIDGHVYRLESREPLAGAKIQLIPNGNEELALDEPSANSAADGSFHFDAVPAGQYSFAAEKGNLHLCFDEPVAPPTVAAGPNTTQPVSLFLYEGRTLIGRITDSVTKRPIEGVEVKLFQEPGRGAMTDSSGFYRMENAYTTYPYGWMAAVVRKSGYVTARESSPHGGFANAPSFEIVQLDATSKESSWDFEMKPIVTVSGRVVIQGGDAVPGAKVQALQHSLEPETQFSDHQGHFDFVGVAGDYTILQADSPGLGLGYSGPIRIGDGNSTQVEIVLRETVKITGRVLDEGRAPVQGAQVIWKGQEPGSQGVAETSVDGSFAFDSIPRNGVSFSAKKDPEFLPTASIVANLAEGAPAEDINLVLSKPHTLRGTVTDEAGNPIPQASVFAASGSYSNGATDDAGSFHLERVPSTIERVSVFHKGHKRVQLTKVPAAEELHIVMKSEPADSNTTGSR